MFTANTNFSVTALGFYLTSDDTASEIVALYDSARNLLVATSVLLSDPNVAGYLFQSSIEDTALFAEMLSLPNDGRYPPRDLTPEQRRQRTLEALMRKWSC